MKMPVLAKFRSAVKLPAGRNVAPVKAQARPVSPVLQKSQVDRWSTYVGERIPTAKIVGQVVGLPVPKRLTESGYLLVRGEKPGLLIREVVHDDASNMYRVKSSGLFGSVEALNSTGRKTFGAEIIDRDELLARAKKFNHFIEVTELATGKRVKVWLLNNFGDQYIAGVTVEGDKLVIKNMEHVESHNRKPVQYKDPKVIKMDFNKFFRQVA